MGDRPAVDAGPRTSVAPAGQAASGRRVYRAFTIDDAAPSA